MARVDPDFANAVEVSEHLLAVTERGIMKGDDDAFVARFHLPLTISTFEGAQILADREDVLRVLNGVRQFIAINSVDQMVRRCISAEFTGANTMQATHVSRYLSKGVLIGHEVTSHGYAIRINGLWKIADNNYAFRDIPALSRALIGEAQRKTGALH